MSVTLNANQMSVNLILNAGQASHGYVPALDSI